MQEIWKPVVGYEGLYEISNLGRVKSLNFHMTGKEQILKGGKGNGGHSYISLHKNNIKFPTSSHRLVATHFIPNPLSLTYVLHKVETLDKNGMLYNGVDNLYWGTQKENIKDMYSKGRANSHFQLNHPKPHLGKLGKLNRNSIKVDQYTLDMEYIKTWDCMTDIQRELGIFQSSISMCCIGKRKSAHGFKWAYSI